MRNRKTTTNTNSDDDPDLINNGEEKGTRISGFFSSSRRVFTLCLAFRFFNALLVQTYFNPDEHWQALEVAHRITFGYGHLTWEWKKGLRSYIHPMLFAILYKLLALLRLDTPWFMARAPRLLQSVFAAIGDLYLYKFSQSLFGTPVAQWTLFSQWTNWFMFFCFTRTFSNNMETVLTLVSLFYWPCMRNSPGNTQSTSREWGLVAAALACAIRPTSAIIWLYVGLYELYLTRDKLKFLFLEVIPIGVLVLTLTCLLDRLMYGSWILVPLNFLKFNFLSSGGDYYGTHPWHWYFTQGFTVMIFSFIPFSLAGILLSKHWKLSGLIAWVLVLYSVLGHKEFRFVLPVLPIALLFSGYSLAALRGMDSKSYKRKGSSVTCTKSPLKLGMAILFLLATNIPMALYMSLFHQPCGIHSKIVNGAAVELASQTWLKCFRGTEDVMNYLSTEALNGKVRSITFLMPCHATPYYSTLHQNLPMESFDCTPSEYKGLLDESDRFIINPVDFMTEYAKNWSAPSHLVLFDSEEKKLKDFLFLHSFIEVKRFFHAHFKVDRDLQASVAVYLKGE